MYACNKKFAHLFHKKIKLYFVSIHLKQILLTIITFELLLFISYKISQLWFYKTLMFMFL